MPSETKFNTLLEKIYEINDLQKASALLGWDRQVNMPKAGVMARAQQLATLNRIVHTTFTADEMGELIEAAAAELNGASYDSDQASLIRYLRESYADSRKLPAEFVVRRTMISNQAHAAWEQAREKDDFASFRPWLEKIIGLAQEMAGYYGYEDEKYDALLDQYEPDMKTAEVRAIFQALKESLAPLVEAIRERGRPLDDAILHQAYVIARQEQFVRAMATAVGYDFSRGHLGTAVHPFAASFSRDDARITTRWYADFLSPALFGTLHESGHAMYEQGTHPDLARTPLARGASMGIHESQSRMIENIVGRSRGFWQAHFPKLQEIFPEQLGQATAGDFYRAINKVQPSLIRVDADELSYNLHIILRFELEQAMLNGDLVAADVPAAWNDKIRQLLGVVPPTDRDGCLQDVHWSTPSFGYFPTYALGNLYAAQFYETAQQQDPAVGQELAEGKTTALLAWLRENIHQHGRKFTPAELVQRATGRPLSHDPFLRYATAKFSEVYNL
ncbi:MAG: carboxypeptidase M32 [Chloroflexi bacterium]|nr:carboxypeptidase M32 [Chloroflexota bacterium]MCI0579536.1 carboxypeptidase M32 [Chloroflexota bacterium]MCI0644424.1 carboxypeptidase M32 [Chloroflexota bacterium]MCI0725411.1 carboxypeptidase M32 [Chloroflexota bacterium]